MRINLSKYKWNLFSIFILILIAESLYHIYVVPKKGDYKNIQTIRIEITCKITENRFNFKNYFCPGYHKSLKYPVTTHLNETYNLDGNVAVTNRENFAYYEIQNVTDKIMPNNYEPLKKIVFNKTDLYLEQIKIEMKSKFNSIKLDEIKKLTTADELLNRSIFKSLKGILQNLRKNIYDNLADYERYEKKFNKTQAEKIYSLKITEINQKKNLDTKFQRLNYFNIFFVTLIFGIFLNVFYTLILEIRKLYKW
ncbi:hypothetical protein OAP15_00855 [Candidatus Pelagibacter sp.]|nr:hypothetical protein [Candidatus Pelagibacter sp.]